MSEYKLIQDEQDNNIYKVFDGETEIGTIDAVLCTIRDTENQALSIDEVLKFESLIKTIFDLDDTHEMNLSGDLIGLRSLFSGLKSDLTAEILTDYHQMIKFTRVYGQSTEIENTVKLSAKQAYRYARDTWKRFEAGEAKIKTEPQAAYLYARNVTGERWDTETETKIKTEPQIWDWYCNFFEIE